MRAGIARLVDKCRLNDPANPRDLRKLKHGLPPEFPMDYMGFLAQLNGLEGFIAENNYLMLYRAEEILELNDGRWEDGFLRAVVVIGSDGGGTAFCVDTSSQPCRYIALGFLDLDLEYQQILGSSLMEFLSALAHGDPS